MSESTRYQRQTIMPEIGVDGQNVLRRARVLCVGAGGLGSPALLYLAAAGIGTIGIVDPDHVEISNLQRQILFVTGDETQPKTDRAGARLRELNPDVTVQLHHTTLIAANALEICSGYDIVLDGTDNFAAKFLINDVCVKLGLPMVYGAISGFEGQAAVFWSKHGGCYRCLYPHPPRQAILNCAEAGVLGAVAGMIGTIQAVEVVKLALGVTHCWKYHLQGLSGRLLTMDARDYTCRVMEVPQRHDCPLCHQNAEAIELRDEEATVCTTDIELMVMEISWREAAARPHLVYLDVREADEWSAGHLLDAVHLPLSALRAGAIPRLDKTREYAVYCQRGQRGKQAAILLRDHGVSHLSNVVGGLLACSLPLVREE
jgi:adenylyltransferase/sulfurtransferase